MSNLTKLVVLISGQGTNLQVILDACAKKKLAAEVVAVISNKAEAKGLERAEKFSIPAIVKSKTAEQTRSEYDSELANIVAAYQPDWIVLAGWMRILSHAFLQHFPNRVINLHPALPGVFPGANAIEEAFAAYQRGEIQETGVMVHLVPDEGVDCGPVLGQKAVNIAAEDTLATLTSKIQQVEHRLLIQVLQKIISTV